MIDFTKIEIVNYPKDQSIMMNKIINNEKGFVLIASLMMLVVLMIIGIAATNTTTIELQISANDKAQKMDFYVAESGWRQGVKWLRSQEVAPSIVNTSIDGDTLVRNYGSGADGVLNDDFTGGTEDGTLTEQNIPYWYKVDEVRDESAGGERVRTYLITSVADGQQAVEVRIEMRSVIPAGGY